MLSAPLRARPAFSGRWAVDDILAGDGVAFFDPHGDAAEAIMRHIPRHRRADIVYFNPYELAIGFNPLLGNGIQRIESNR